MGVSADSIKPQVESAIRDALRNRGFFKSLEDTASHFPEIHTVRLMFTAKSNVMQRAAVSVEAMPYDTPQTPNASSYFSIIAKQIEDYLNRYSDLFPEADYSNFYFILDVPVK